MRDSFVIFVTKSTLQESRVTKLALQESRSEGFVLISLYNPLGQSVHFYELFRSTTCLMDSFCAIRP
jgi:hypothetical protein